VTVDIGHEDSATVGCHNNARGSLRTEFWWCPSFHWKSLWTEDTSHFMLTRIIHKLLPLSCPSQ